MEKKKKGCPAVTLLIKTPKEISVDIILALKVQSSWPHSTQEGMPIENWLGGKVKKSLKLQPFYLVPKPAKEGNVFQGILNVKVNLKTYKRTVNVIYKGSQRLMTAIGILRVIRLNRLLVQDGSLVSDGIENGIVVVVTSNTEL